MNQVIDISTLRIGAELGDGTQGKVFAVESGAPFSFPVVYKEFKKGLRGSVQGLNSLFTFREGLDQSNRDYLDSHLTWPLVPVRKGRADSGYLMQLIGNEFFIELFAPSGKKRRPCTHQLLIKHDDGFQSDHGFVVSVQDRLRLALSFSRIYAFLHRHRLIYGDMNWLNALWTLKPEPRILFIDCDSVRVEGMSSAFEQLHADFWKPPENLLGNQASQTFHTDRWKLAVAVLRILSPGQDGFNIAQRDGTREADYQVVESLFSQRLVDLLRSALRNGKPSKNRPEPTEWIEVLLDEIEKLTRTRPAANPVTDYSNPIDVFGDAVFSPSATPLTLLKLLAEIPAQSALEIIAGLSIQDWQGKLSAFQSDFAELMRLASQTQAPIDEATERRIAQLAYPHRDLLRFPWANRFGLALSRIIEWDGLKKLLKSNAPENEILEAAENCKALNDDFAPFRQLRQRLEDWRRDIPIFEEFLQEATKPQPIERRLAAIWNRSTTVANLRLATHPHPQLGDRSPLNRARAATKRIKAIDELAKVIDKTDKLGPLTADGEQNVVNKWEEVQPKVRGANDPELAKLLPRVEQAKYRIEKLPGLEARIAGNQDDDDFVLKLWGDGKTWENYQPAQAIQLLAGRAQRRKAAIEAFVSAHQKDPEDDVVLATFWRNLPALKDSRLSQTTTVTYQGTVMTVAERNALAQRRAPASRDLQNLIDRQDKSNQPKIAVEAEIVEYWDGNRILFEQWPKAMSELRQRVDDARLRCGEAKRLDRALAIGNEHDWLKVARGLKMPPNMDILAKAGGRISTARKCVAVLDEFLQAYRANAFAEPDLASIWAKEPGLNTSRIARKKVKIGSEEIIPIERAQLAQDRASLLKSLESLLKTAGIDNDREVVRLSKKAPDAHPLFDNLRSKVDEAAGRVDARAELEAAITRAGPIERRTEERERKLQATWTDLKKRGIQDDAFPVSHLKRVQTAIEWLKEWDAFANAFKVAKDLFDQKKFEDARKALTKLKSTFLNYGHLDQVSELERDLRKTELTAIEEENSRELEDALKRGRFWTAGRLVLRNHSDFESRDDLDDDTKEQYRSALDLHDKASQHAEEAKELENEAEALPDKLLLPKLALLEDAIKEWQSASEICPDYDNATSQAKRLWLRIERDTAVATPYRPSLKHREVGCIGALSLLLPIFIMVILIWGFATARNQPDVRFKSIMELLDSGHYSLAQQTIAGYLQKDPSFAQPAANEFHQKGIVFHKEAEQSKVLRASQEKIQAAYDKSSAAFEVAGHCGRIDSMQNAAENREIEAGWHLDEGRVSEAVQAYRNAADLYDHTVQMLSKDENEKAAQLRESSRNARIKASEAETKTSIGL